MRLRNWLLTGTSLGLLVLAPMSAAKAQDAALSAAYQAYTEAQQGGDAAAIDAAKQAFGEQCVAAGFTGIDECVASLSGAPAAAPAEPAAPAAEAPAAPAQEEAAPPAAEEPAPPAEAAPAPEAAPAEAAPADAAPVEAASSEEPAAPAPKNKRDKRPAPSAEESAPAAAEAPAAPASEEAAPVPEQAAPAVESSAEPAAPVSTEAAPPADTGAAPAKLQRAVDAYNQAVADLGAGKKGAQGKLDKAKAQIDSICTAGGFTDTDACLAQFGLALSPLPAAAPVASEEQPATSSEPPAEVTAPSTETPAPSEQPISEMPNADEKVTDQATEVLPADIKPEEAAPILDSAKDAKTDADKGQPVPADTTSTQPAQPEQVGPPPTDDKSAQKNIKRRDHQKVDEEQGKKIEPPPVLTPVVPTDNKDVKVVKKIDNGVVFQFNLQLFIDNPEQERDRLYDRDRDQISYEQLSRGRTRETIERADGTKIVTIRDRDGDVLQRSKILKNGREIVLASDSGFDDNGNGNGNGNGNNGNGPGRGGQWRDPGDDLPPLRLNIPARDYILDADTADEDEVQDFLDQPPVEQVQRIYSIDEVKRSARLRDSVRRLEVGGLTFDTGKATISRDQVGTLSDVAKAMLKLLDKNPGEVFLIEGHTDAVGSDVANLGLSDQRASTVARILTDFYDVPPENLVTQGYGERFLKVNTDGPEPINRRVTVKRITPLISYADNG